MRENKCSLSMYFCPFFLFFSLFVFCSLFFLIFLVTFRFFIIAITCEKLVRPDGRLLPRYELSFHQMPFLEALR